MWPILPRRAYGNSISSEWGLPTEFNATDTFLAKWADAQKLAYSQGAGWLVSFDYSHASVRC